jgi:hypothetical protein
LRRSLEATFEEVHLERVTFYVDMVEEERTDWLFLRPESGPRRV